MKLIVGLGNPGKKHAANRHNIGFMAIERIHEARDFTPWRKRFLGEVAEGRLGNEKCLLLKPATYMNESGQSIGEAARFYKLEPDDVILFHDELDLVPGKLKAKRGGGNAGHNGLRSTTAHIGNDYVRIRLGIGHPGRKDMVYRYVLGDFAKADRDWLDALFDAIVAASDHLVDADINRFMTAVAERLRTEDDALGGSKAAAARRDAEKRRAKSGAQVPPPRTNPPGAGKWAVVAKTSARRSDATDDKSEDGATDTGAEKSGLGAIGDQLRAWLKGKAQD